MSAKSNAGWFLLAALAAAACGGEADEGAEAGEEPPAPARVVSLPDTTAEAVWAYLEAQGYASWPRWPGTEALYSGNEPHGMLLTTYVNSPMAEALEGGRTTELPDGAIVVKENYMPDSTLAAVTVMYQVSTPDENCSFVAGEKVTPDGGDEPLGRLLLLMFLIS